MATPVGLLVLLMVFDFRLGILSLIPIVLGFIVMSAMTGKGMEVKMKEYQNALADMSNEAVEYVRGIPVVKTFGQTIFSFKRFKGAIDNYEKWVIAYTKALRLPMMGFTTAINSVFAFLIAGAIVFSRHGMTNELLLNLIFYIIITPVIGTTLTKLMFMSENNILVADAIARMDEILNEAPLSESEAPKQPKDNSIEFADVCYSYDGEKQALDHISLSVRSGEKIALVGPSGGGKTTLCSLLPRFYDVTEGSVSVDGKDVRSLTLKSLRSAIGIVQQDVYMFGGTIRENIAYGKPDATMEEIIEAAKNANIHDFIVSLPDGYDTDVGERGTRLSGGQKQRLSIARVFLKNPKILILDEATSALDNESEQHIQQSLERLAKNRTTIVIAHRLSTIRNADEILVLDDDGIQERGDHKTLLAKNGIYAKYYNMQFEGLEA